MRRLWVSFANQRFGDSVDQGCRHFDISTESADKMRRFTHRAGRRYRRKKEKFIAFDLETTETLVGRLNKVRDLMPVRNSGASRKKTQSVLFRPTSCV
jgi:hypothetical protein